MTSPLRLHSRLAEQRMQMPPARSRDAAKWIPATTVLIALSTALLWLRGWIYRNALLDEWGIDASMLPVDWHVMVSSGAIQIIVSVVSLCMILLLIVMGAALVLGFFRTTTLRAFEARFLSSKKQAGSLLQKLFLTAIVGICIAFIIALLVAFQGVIDPYQAGKNDAQATLATLMAARCEPVATQKNLTHVRIERRVLLPDGKEGLAVDEGHPVACTEKHCALLQFPTRNHWRAIVVPLDKLNRFESYSKVQRAADCP